MHIPFLALCLFLFAVPANAESFRTLVAGSVELSADNPEGSSVNMNYSNSLLIQLGRGSHFFRGIELEISMPQIWLANRGSLAMELYAELDRLPPLGTQDLEGRHVAFEPLPNKLNIVYQVPVRQSHGLRTTPYAIALSGVTLPSSFPVLFKLMPIIKGLSDEVERMQFVVTAKPILGDEGTVRLVPRYPAQLRGRPFTVLIDDIVVENIADERLLKEGEHHLVVLSNDYRNESRRFMVERAKTLELIINLQDPTPLVIFEAPGNARIFLDNSPIPRESGPIPVEPGTHEARFQVGDYTLTKTIVIQRGKTYRVALTIGIDIEESE